MKDRNMEITPEQIKEIRDKTGLSMMDAKNYLTLLHQHDKINNLMLNGTTEDKIKFLMDKEINNIIAKLKDKYFMLKND